MLVGTDSPGHWPRTHYVRDGVAIAKTLCGIRIVKPVNDLTGEWSFSDATVAHERVQCSGCRTHRGVLEDLYGPGELGEATGDEEDAAGGDRAGQREAAPSRMDALLRDAAEAFGDGRSPFSTGWLAERGVSAHECMDLEDRIARVLLGYLDAPRVVRECFPVFAAEGMSAEAKELAFHRHYELAALRRAADPYRGAAR